MINLRKINILVGRNSSGKSTVLRFLPLLRQSVEQPTKGPILWFGRLVDFGSFETAARDNDVSRGVGLDFYISISKRNQGFRRALHNSLQQLDRGEFFWTPNLNVRVSITLGRSAKDRVGNVRKITLNIRNDRVDILFGETGIEEIEVMSEVINLGHGESWGTFRGKLIPAVSLMQDFYLEDDEGTKHEFTDVALRPFADEINLALRKIAHGRTSDERITSIANRLKYAPEKTFFDNLKNLAGITADLRSRIEALGPSSHELNTLRRYVLTSKISELIASIDEEIAAFASSVRYVEPLRATAERYYRQQDLAVDEVDSRGENTAMFLESLSDVEMRRLTRWMKDNLGFWVVVEAGVGHVQVKIADEKHPPRNIADLGFGYSQILPIVLQLWKSTSTFGSQKKILLAMEQPELHLHPDYQAKLADLMASSVSTSSPIRVLLETHSDHLINRFGSLINEGKLDPDDIQVLVVNEDNDKTSEVSVAEFLEDGTLGSGWPLGFFTPEDT